MKARRKQYLYSFGVRIAVSCSRKNRSGRRSTGEAKLTHEAHQTGICDEKLQTFTKLAATTALKIPMLSAARKKPTLLNNRLSSAFFDYEMTATGYISAERLDVTRARKK